MRPGQQNIVERAAANLKNGTTFPRFLYACAGTVGEREALFSAGLRQVDSLLGVYPEHGLIWQPEILEGQDHFTIVPVAVNAGLLALTRSFRVDEAVLADLIEKKTRTCLARSTIFMPNVRLNMGSRITCRQVLLRIISRT